MTFHYEVRLVKPRWMFWARRWAVMRVNSASYIVGAPYRRRRHAEIVVSTLNAIR